MTFKGYIYKITNKENTCCYIGSTRQKYPKKRYHRHKKDCFEGCERYFDLFDCENFTPSWEILSEGEFENVYELRKMENYYINLHRGMTGVKCTNKNMAYVPPELKLEAQKVAKRKYMNSAKGKEMKKWANYRMNKRKKLLKDLKDLFNQTQLQKDGLVLPSSLTSPQVHSA